MTGYGSRDASGNDVSGQPHNEEGPLRPIKNLSMHQSVHTRYAGNTPDSVPLRGGIAHASYCTSRQQ